MPFHLDTLISLQSPHGCHSIMATVRGYEKLIASAALQILFAEVAASSITGAGNATVELAATISNGA
jgi:hypothetical protein